MNVKKSTLVRAAIALSALTTGVLATVTLSGGAQASDVAPVGAPAALSAPPAAGPASAAPSSAPTAVASRAVGGRTASAGGPTTSRPAPAAPAAPAARGVSAPPAPLAPAQLPDSVTAGWKPIAAPHTQAVSHRIGLNECAGVDGAASWQQQGYVSSFNTPAIQDSFSFADPTAAQSAYTAVLSAMDGCQQQSRALQTSSKISADAQVTKTAAATDATAYARQWNAVAGMSAPGPQTDHIYVVRSGSVLTVLQFAVPAGASGGNSTTAADDQATLTTIAAQLTSTAAAG
ncbi:hypothetical protein P3T36_001997 [Kitasatospora sp. MAP12-15]|uniref:hypothetical protein n=1 Tax=unclassified Kitasatospora TaxID=2633591 RepID=UPI002473CBF3|nr:hypothetical protein [Kitasatospora sp. MAP12-44]MDH6111682.1 hypothetical protein [Kitasatospora sp. MAP12-44]